MYQAMHIHRENVANREAAGPGLFGVAAGMLTLQTEKENGFCAQPQKVDGTSA